MWALDAHGLRFGLLLGGCFNAVGTTVCFCVCVSACACVWNTQSNIRDVPTCCGIKRLAMIYKVSFALWRHLCPRPHSCVCATIRCNPMQMGCVSVAFSDPPVAPQKNHVPYLIPTHLQWSLIYNHVQLRCVSVAFSDPHVAYGIVMAGQSLSAVAQPFLLSGSTKLAASWFHPTQRSIANAVGSIANPVGIALASVLSPVIVPSDSPGDISTAFYVYAVLSVVVAIAAFAIR